MSLEMPLCISQQWWLNNMLPKGGWTASVPLKTNGAENCCCLVHNMLFYPSSAKLYYWDVLYFLPSSASSSAWNISSKKSKEVQ